MWLAVAFALAFLQVPAERVFVADWQSLHDAFARDSSLLHAYRKTDAYKNIVQHGTRDTFRAMIEQRESPLIALAGYTALKQRFPRESFRYGLQVLGRVDDQSMFHATIMMDLSAKIDQELFDECFSDLTSVPPQRDTLDFAVLVGAVNAENLNAWFHGARRAEAALAWRWLVLESVIENRGDGKLSSAMHEEMRRASWTPGYGRRVYLRHATELDEHFMAVLHAMLSTADLDAASTLLVIRARREFIRTEFDLSGLPADRRAEIERIVNR